MTTSILDLPDLGRAFDQELQQRFGVSGVRGTTPSTRVRLTHAFRLKTHRGRTIGAVAAVGYQQGRTIDTEFEVRSGLHGEPSAVIPQELATRTLRITRYDLYFMPFERAFGTRDIVMLTDQILGLRLREVWGGPAGILNTAGEVYEYTECFFSDLGRTLSANDTRVSQADATVIWGGRRRVA